MEQTNQNQFKCSGDCLNCRVSPNERKTQWQYCAAQFTYNTMRMIESLHGEIKSMQGTVDELKAKIDAIQNSEAMVLAPDAEEEHGIKIDQIAQIGDGAGIDAPIQIKN